MATRDKLTWWSYRRRRWTVGFLLALAALGGWQWFSEPAAELVLYNDGSRPLGVVQAELGTTVLEFAVLEPRQSQRLGVPAGVRAELGLWLPGDPPRRVTGPWFDGRAAAQVVARVDDFGEVTFSTMPSWRARVVDWLR